MASAEISCVCALIVTYHPSFPLLRKTLDALQDQVARIIIFDNSGGDRHDLSELRNEYLFDLLMDLGNVGIAEAQNRLVRYVSRAYNPDFVVFFDQDSIPSPGHIAGLLKCFDHDTIACVGPRIARYDGSPYNSMLQQLVRSKHDAAIDCERVDQLISSGSMVRTRVFCEVGLMESRLFVDAVDHEWCWRAKQLGYEIVQSHKVVLRHRFGNGEIAVLGLKIQTGVPQRHYYQVRNYLLLVRRRYVPLRWKCLSGMKHLIRIFVIVLLQDKKRERLRYVWAGCVDGVRGIDDVRSDRVKLHGRSKGV